MNTFTLRLAATALAFASTLGVAHAAVVTQTKFFESTAVAVSGSGSTTVVDSSFFKTSFTPFDSSLGKLTGFSVSWAVQAGGVISAKANPGYLSLNGGGSYEINGLSYSDDPFAGLTNVIANQNGALVQASASDSTSWLAGDAGKTYNPALLAAVLGSKPVVVDFASAVNASYNNISNGSVGASGQVTLRYIYDVAAGSGGSPAANDVPEPTSLALAFGGLLAAALVRRAPGGAVRRRA